MKALHLLFALALVAGEVLDASEAAGLTQFRECAFVAAWRLAQLLAARACDQFRQRLSW